MPDSTRNDALLTRTTAGKALQPIANAIGVGREPIGRVAGAPGMDGHISEVPPVEPDVGRFQVRERAAEQARRHQRRQAQRDLNRDERAGQPLPATGDRRGPRPKGIAEIGARRLDRRREPEQQGRDEGERAGEHERSQVDVEVVRAARVAAGVEENVDRLREGVADDERGGGADERQHDALDQMLPQQPAAGRAERNAQRRLVLARDRSGEEQVRDVRAHDEQQQADEHHQQPQRAPVGSAQRIEPAPAGRRRQLREVPRIDRRAVGNGEAREALAECASRRVRRDAGPPPADHPHPPVPVVLGQRPGPGRSLEDHLRRERRVDVRPLAGADAEELRSRDTDDAGRDVVDAQRTAGHVRAPRERVHPEPVADHDHRLVADAILLAEKAAPDDRRDAQALEEVAADELDADLGRRGVVHGDAGWFRIRADAHERREHLLLAGELTIEARRHRRPPAPGAGERPVLAVDVLHSRWKVVCRPLEDGERVGIGHRQRLEDRGVEQADDRDVGPQAEGERDHHRERRPRCAAQLPQAVDGVAGGRLQPLHDPGAARVLLEAGQVAEPQAGVARADVGGVHVEMKLQLFSDLGAVPRAAKRTREPGEHTHADLLRSSGGPW
jgi:hypothetical protein